MQARYQDLTGNRSSRCSRNNPLRYRQCILPTFFPFSHKRAGRHPRKEDTKRAGKVAVRGILWCQARDLPFRFRYGLSYFLSPYRRQAEIALSSSPVWQALFFLLKAFVFSFSRRQCRKAALPLFLYRKGDCWSSHPPYSCQRRGCISGWC